MKPVPWLWEGMMVGGDSNLIIAPPKVGKSALITGLIGAMARGERQFLGKRLNYGPEAPPVFIYGTDQPGSCWAELFAREGLLDDDNSFKEPIRKLARSGDDLILNKEGLAQIQEDAANNPGCVMFFDSYFTLVAPLGLDEARSEFALPAKQLRDLLAPYQVSWTMLHHSNKSVSGGNAIGASRGSNALPGVFSWTLLMNWLRLPSDGTLQTDFRVTVHGSGRGAKPHSVFCELIGEGTATHWEIIGDGEQAQKAEHLVSMEDKISGSKQDNVFQVLRMEWENNRNGLTTSELASRTKTLIPYVQSSLNTLERKGLVKKSGLIETGGRPANIYWVHEAVTPAEQQGPSLSQTLLICEKGIKGSEVDNATSLSLSTFNKKNNIDSGWESEAKLSKGVLKADPFNNPLPEGLRVGAKVQKQNANGGWDERPFVIAEAPSEHNVTIALLGNSMLRFSAQRWNAEIRAWPAHPPDEGKAILELNEPF